MVGVLEFRRSVLCASRSACKGEERYCRRHHPSAVNPACPKLARDVQNRSTLLRCVVLHITHLPYGSRARASSNFGTSNPTITQSSIRVDHWEITLSMKL